MNNNYKILLKIVNNSYKYIYNNIDQFNYNR